MIKLSLKKELKIPIQKPKKLGFSAKIVPKEPISSPKSQVISKSVSDYDKYLEWIKTIPGFIEGLTNTYDEPTKLYSYQIAFMMEQSIFKIVNKARQVGMSFCISGASLARAHLQNNYKAIYISINREEASNKIEFARMLFDSMPSALQKKKIVDNKFSLVFESPDGKHRTSLISLAQRAPRGPGYNVDVFLDEFAHFQWPHEIYIASLPIITRGNGSISALSTPLGNKGDFFDIWTDVDAFAEFKRFEIPWWICPELCIDLKKALKYAPKMLTEERLKNFGTKKLIQIYRSLDTIDFQQEYECSFIDEATAYFPLSLIHLNLFSYDEDNWIREIDLDVYDKNKYYAETKYPKINLKCYKTVEELLEAIQSQKISKNLYGGFDIGRKHDTSELCVIEEIPIGNAVLKIARLYLTLRNVLFKEQEAILDDLLSKDVLEKLCMDATGLGMNMSENLGNKYRIVESVEFTNAIKAKMVKKVKIFFEDIRLLLPDDYDLVKQIHSIRRTITENSNEKFDTDKVKRLGHHADRFWATALANHAGTDPTSYEALDDKGFRVDHQKIFSPMRIKEQNNNRLLPPGEYTPRVLRMKPDRSEIDTILTQHFSVLDAPSDINDLMRNSWRDL